MHVVLKITHPFAVALGWVLYLSLVTGVHGCDGYYSRYFVIAQQRIEGGYVGVEYLLQALELGVDAVAEVIEDFVGLPGGGGLGAGDDSGQACQFAVEFGGVAECVLTG